MNTYRTILKSASSYKFNEGWYFEGSEEILYEGPDKAAAIAAFDDIDMAERAAYYGTAVSREVVEIDEDGDLVGTATHWRNPHDGDLYDIYDGAEGWWLILTERSSQVSARGERQYRIDSFKGSYYVALYQADNRFARQILEVEANEEEMRARVEERDIAQYLTADELKSIGMEVDTND